MDKSSRAVESNQEGIHKNLLKLIERNKKYEFKKPYSEFSKETFKDIMSWINTKKDQQIILDMCCGVGESSFHLAVTFPDQLVIGIDKSIDRIDRQNNFKSELPNNLLLVRGDLLDLWRMFSENKNKLSISKQYILYPNPYPKQKHVKLRWHGHAIFPYIMSLGVEIELRSNWELYLLEFKIAAEQFNYVKNNKVDTFIPVKLITPFERKFFNSSQVLYSLNLKPL